MITRVVSFGCSLVWGDELVDTKPTGGRPSNLSFAALVAAHYNVPYLCKANRGSGNDQIERHLTEYLKQDKQHGDLVLIGWTDLRRREYMYKGEYVNCLFGVMGFPSHISEFHNTYMEDENWRLVDRDHHDRVFRSQTLLDHFGIRHVMVNTLASHPLVPELKLITDINMYNWVKKNGYPVGQHGHPLLDAHRDFAAILIAAIQAKHQL